MENEPFFLQLVEDCKDILTESSFASRWSLVEGYHLLGTRILQDEVNLTKGGSTLRSRIASLAKYVGKRERSLYYAVEFVRKFPDLNSLPEGKDTNWYRIVNKYLTTETDKHHVTMSDLRSIIYEIDKLLKTEYQKALQCEMSGIQEYSKLSDFIYYLQVEIAGKY